MSQIGFVYVLRNEYMPDVYKIGCTERSPHARAEELSKATGVPDAFKVVCFVEVNDFQAVESSIHRSCKDYRINPAREFFSGGFIWALRLMYHNPMRLSFTSVDEEFIEGALMDARINGLWDLADPWAPAQEPEKPESPSLTVVQGGADAA